MQADVSKQEVQVEYDPKATTPEKLAQAISEHSGFKGSVIR